MGATISKPSHSPMFLKPPSHQAHVSNGAFDDGFGNNDNKSSLLHDMMMMSNSFGDQQVSSAFGDHRQAFNGIMVGGNNNFVEVNNNNNNINPPKNYKSMELEQLGRSGTDNNNNDEALTRDFLGLRAPFSSSAAAAAAAASHGHVDFFNINMAGLDHHVNSSSSSAYTGQQSDHQNQTSWQG